MAKFVAPHLSFCRKQMAFDHHLALILCLMIVTFCCKCIFQCLLSPLMIMVGWWYVTAVATCVRSQKMVVSSTPLELPSARKPIFANFIMYLILGRAWLIFAFIRHIILIYIHSYPLIHIFICNNLLWYVFPFLLFFDVWCYFPLLAFLPSTSNIVTLQCTREPFSGTWSIDGNRIIASYTMMAMAI